MFLSKHKHIYSIAVNRFPHVDEYRTHTRTLVAVSRFSHNHPSPSLPSSFEPHPLPSPLTTAPKFTACAFAVHAVLEGLLANVNTIKAEDFATFPQHAHGYCMRADSGMRPYEIYILFIFIHILRTLMLHLAVAQDSDIDKALSSAQAQLISILHRTAPTPPSLDFKFTKPLPHSGGWIPLNAPSRSRTWIIPFSPDNHPFTTGQADLLFSYSPPLTV